MVIIVLGAIKAAQVMKNEWVKDTKRNETIAPVEGSAALMSDRTARSETGVHDWWESKDGVAHASAQPAASHPTNRTTADPNAISAWSRTSTVANANDQNNPPPGANASPSALSTSSAAVMNASTTATTPAPAPATVVAGSSSTAPSASSHALVVHRSFDSLSSASTTADATHDDAADALPPVVEFPALCEADSLDEAAPPTATAPPALLALPAPPTSSEPPAQTTPHAPPTGDETTRRRTNPPNHKQPMEDSIPSVHKALQGAKTIACDGSFSAAVIQQRRTQQQQQQQQRQRHATTGVTGNIPKQNDNRLVGTAGAQTVARPPPSLPNNAAELPSLQQHPTGLGGLPSTGVCTQLRPKSMPASSPRAPVLQQQQEQQRGQRPQSAFASAETTRKRYSRPTCAPSTGKPNGKAATTCTTFAMPTSSTAEAGGAGAGAGNAHRSRGVAITTTTVPTARLLPPSSPSPPAAGTSSLYSAGSMKRPMRACSNTTRAGVTAMAVVSGRVPNGHVGSSGRSTEDVPPVRTHPHARGHAASREKAGVGVGVSGESCLAAPGALKKRASWNASRRT